MRIPRSAFWLGWLWASASIAHDIPNARVDRSIQVTIGPGRVDLAYEVSLAELTLTQDLRNLVGSLPGGTPEAWYRRYGEETAPLNGRGLLLSVDGDPVDLIPDGFAIDRETHPRFTFRYHAEIPASGRLALIDSNYAASEGASRLAVRARSGVGLAGYDGPPDVDSIAARPAWEMTAEEERRGKRVALAYRPEAVAVAEAATTARNESKPTSPDRLGRLLDRAGGISIWVLGATAFGLGMVHSLQPGHGKSLILVASMDGRGSLAESLMLGLLAATAHMASVGLIAALLWFTVESDLRVGNAAIVRATGFVLAAIGSYRLGQALRRDPPDHAEPAASPGRRGTVLAVGMAAGVVPCWDAVGLLVLSAAIGRLADGLILVACFSLGLAVVLVAVGSASSRLAGRFDRLAGPIRLTGAVFLLLIGVSFLAS